MTITAEQSHPRLLPDLKDIRGEVLAPGDPGFPAARAAWNLNADHRPALVVLVADADDVRTAVRAAGRAGLGVGVLATGHGTGQPCRGGLLVNTRRMRRFQIDPVRRIARVEAGALWEDVVEAAGRHGLAGLPGSSTRVGVVGSTLGGGFGWLGRRYGLAAHSVLRADVVTASGDLVTTDCDHHADLFWGLAGSAGNLGAVTALELALHPVDRVYAGNLFYPLERARDLLEFHARWSESVPPELTSAVTFRSFPPLPSVPEPLRGQSLVALRGCFCGHLRDGKDLVDQARNALGPAVVDTFAELPASGLAAVSADPIDPLPALSHSELLGPLTPELIETLLALAGPEAGSPLVMLELRQLGGALAGPAGALSPMAHTSAAYSLNAIGVTPTAAQTSAVRAHLTRVAEDLRPFATGASYVNFLDLDGATPDRVRAAYSDEDWCRLVALKDRYDPDNVFRFNRNIPPTHRK